MRTHNIHFAQYVSKGAKKTPRKSGRYFIEDVLNKSFICRGEQCSPVI